MGKKSKSKRKLERKRQPPPSVSSATNDRWADPIGEYISTRDASAVWSQIYGINSSLPMEQPPPENPIQSGRLHYHLRSGGHGLTLYDWQQHMSMAKSMGNNCTIILTATWRSDPIFSRAKPIACVSFGTRMAN